MFTAGFVRVLLQDLTHAGCQNARCIAGCAQAAPCFVQLEAAERQLLRNRSDAFRQNVCFVLTEAQHSRQNFPQAAKSGRKTQSKESRM